MTNYKSDSPLSIGPYLQAIERVEIQFALIRFALKTLSKGKIQGFYKARLQAELSAVDPWVTQLKEDCGKDTKDKLEGFNEMWREHLRKEHRKHNKPADIRFKVEFSEDRLNQSELLLLVAHFESFMKLVHRTFLRAAPAKVFSKGNKERGEYFSKHYGISFSSDKDIEDLKEIIKLRNKISHEIYAPPPPSAEQVPDQALVGDEMLKRARGLFRVIPITCIWAGAKEYPSHFE